MDFFEFGNQPKVETLESKLFNFCSRNKVEQVNEFLQNNSTVDPFHLVNGFNSAHISAKKGHLQIVNLLLEKFPDISLSTTPDGRNPAMIAAYSGRLDIVQAILNHQRIHNQLSISFDNSGNSILHFAAWGGFLDIVKLLVEDYNFDVNIKNNDGLNPLQLASAGNFSDIVCYILSQNDEKISVDKSITGLNALHRAASYGSLETLKLLIEEKSFDINECTLNGSTALHFACQHNHESVVEFLTPISAKNVQNDFGLTPIHYACISGNLNIVKILIKNGIDPLIKSVQGESPFHIAAASGKHEICRFLFEVNDINIFDLDTQGKSSIDKALESGFKELANNLCFWDLIKKRNNDIKIKITGYLALVN